MLQHFKTLLIKIQLTQVSFLLIDLRGREKKERGRSTDLLFHLFMYALGDSCRRPDQGSKPQPWCAGTML